MDTGLVVGLAIRAGQPVGEEPADERLPEVGRVPTGDALVLLRRSIWTVKAGPVQLPG
jgi:hypothetical protein